MAQRTHQPPESGDSPANPPGAYMMAPPQQGQRMPYVPQPYYPMYNPYQYQQQFQAMPPRGVQGTGAMVGPPHGRHPPSGHGHPGMVMPPQYMYPPTMAATNTMQYGRSMSYDAVNNAGLLRAGGPVTGIPMEEVQVEPTTVDSPPSSNADKGAPVDASVEHGSAAVVTGKESSGAGEAAAGSDCSVGQDGRDDTDDHEGDGAEAEWSPQFYGAVADLERIRFGSVVLSRQDLQAMPVSSYIHRQLGIGVLVPSQYIRSAPAPAPEKTAPTAPKVQAVEKLTLREYFVTNPVDAASKQRRQRIRLRGLLNKGNMCFLNAVLQPLAQVRLLFDVLAGVDWDLITDPGLDTMPILKCMARFVKEFEVEPAKEGTPTNESSLGPIDVEYVHTAIRGSRLDVSQAGTQEDAEEFLAFLLDGLHEEIADAMSLSPVYNTLLRMHAGPINSVKSDADDGWAEVGKKNKSVAVRETGLHASPIIDIFYGRTRVTVNNQGSKSVKLEPWGSLKVHVEAVSTVNESLTEMFGNEELDGGILLQKRLDKLPPYLIIHVKRFTFNKETSEITKLNDPIVYDSNLEFKEEWLSRELASDRSVSRQYELFGVVHHLGRSAMGGAHYVCDIRHPDGTQMGGEKNRSQWFKMNDAVVSPAGRHEVLARNTTAYVLFYRQLT